MVRADNVSIPSLTNFTHQKSQFTLCMVLHQAIIQVEVII